MSIWTLLIRELAHRWFNAVICLTGVTGCSGLLVGVLVSLELHALESDAIVRRHQAEAQAEMDQLRAEVSGAMHHLGYHATVLPRDQSLGDWYADDYATETMPESCSVRLRETANLLDRYLPRLRRKITWPEKNWTVIVVGVGEEVVLDTSVGPATPLVKSICSGACTVGYELHQAQGLQPGDTISVLGTGLEIQACNPETGTKDDITLFLKLEDAQRLLKQPAAINEILIVEHLNVWGRTAEVRRRVCQVLPDCQMVEIASETMSRAHARVKVAEEAAAAIEQELHRRAVLESERKRVARTFWPVGIVVTSLWVAILMYLNVRDRAQEIGILMAQGLRTRSVQMLFFAKAILLGMVGGVVGFVGGSAAVLCWQDAAVAVWSGVLLGSAGLPLAVVVSVGACLLGTWLPAWIAVNRDVAVVLREE